MINITESSFRKPPSCLTEYSINAEFGVTASFEYKDLDKAINNTARRLHEEIYGEFREDILRCIEDIYARRHAAALDQLEIMLAQINGERL